MTVIVRGWGPIRPTFARELIEARLRADLPVMVGLAFRQHRRCLEMSQRAYADWRGWSKGQQSRLELAAGDLKLGALIDALRGTGYQLVLIKHEEGAGHDQAAEADEGDGGGDLEIMSLSDWANTEFIARDEAGRRFPAHRAVRRTSTIPIWWIWRYSTSRVCSPEWTTD